MNLLKITYNASTAVDALANAPGASHGDRAQQLSALRQRIDGYIVQLGTLAEAQARRDLRAPVSQREGD